MDGFFTPPITTWASPKSACASPIDIAACVEFKRVGEDLLGTHVGERADQLYNDSVPEAKMGIPGFRV